MYDKDAIKRMVDNIGQLTIEITNLDNQIKSMQNTINQLNEDKQILYTENQKLKGL